VRMIEEGQLLVLEQSDFIELISKPMVREVEANIVQSLVEKGYQILDVRCKKNMPFCIFQAHVYFRYIC
jgi:hypothetical protein